MAKFLTYILTLIVTSFALAQNNSLFDQGNALYTNGDYANAITKYEGVLSNNQHSAELYFNLANAHYKLNHVAPSIYYYEKALLLNPNDETIKTNLAYAKNMTIDAIETVPEIGFSKFLNSFTNTFSFDGWAKLSVITMLMFVVLTIVYFFTFSTGKKRLSFIGSVVFLAFMVTALSFAFHKYNIDKNNQPAIVFAQESLVKTEPNNRSEQAFTLHEGTKVQVLDTINNWKQIKISDGKTGWILASDIKLLKAI